MTLIQTKRFPMPHRIITMQQILSLQVHLSQL